MSDRVKIRAEVQRLRRELGEQRDVNLDELIAYIDSMPEETASEDLEEEILCRWEDDPHTLWPKCPYSDFKNIAYHFAEWQKKQTMKDAVYGYVSLCHDYPYRRSLVAIEDGLTNLEYAEKVKIVIVKESML